MKIQSHPFALSAIAWALCLMAVPVASAMSLPQAYEKALAQDATIRASRAALASGQERAPQARSQLLPSIQANVSRNQNSLDSTNTDLFGQSTTTNSKYFSFAKSISLRQSIFNRGRSINYQQAQDFENEAIATHQRNLQDLLVRVSSAYVDALFAQDQLRLVVTQKQQDQALLTATRRGLQAGSGTRTDIDEAQARLDMTLAKELEAEQQVSYARRQLEILIDAPVEKLSEFNPQGSNRLPQELAPLQSWLDQALERSPDILIANARVAYAEKELRKAQAGHMPTLDAIVQWSDSGNENVTRLNSRFVNTSAGLQLTIPIYQGGAVNSQIRQALAEQTRALESLEMARRDLSLRVHKEYRGVTEGRLKISALLQAEHSAMQLLESTRRSREGGFRTVLDVLNAEQQLATTRRDLILARFQAIVARIRLNALTGKDPQAVIDEIAVAFTP